MVCFFQDDFHNVLAFRWVRYFGQRNTMFCCCFVSWCFPNSVVFLVFKNREGVVLFPASFPFPPIGSVSLFGFAFLGGIAWGVCL